MLQIIGYNTAFDSSCLRRLLCFSTSSFSFWYFSVRYTSNHVRPSPRKAVHTDMNKMTKQSVHILSRGDCEKEATTNNKSNKINETKALLMNQRLYKFLKSCKGYEFTDESRL